MAGPAVPPATPFPGPDLTNQNSPEAAGFTGGASVTMLHGPPVILGLQPVADGFDAPMGVSFPADGTSRLFLMEQEGLVRIFFMNGTVLPDPFIDLRDRMVPLNPGYDERGLYSLAFHPQYASNGRVFVYYAAPLRPGAPAGWSCTNRLSEFRISAADPNRLDPASERVLLEIDKPAQNHNGGPLLFGPDDGSLSLTLGDGGGADDTGSGHTPGTGNAQDMTKLLGKVIRIDVDTPGGYTIPPDNPFTGRAGARPEIFASGFRNPASAAFDSAPGSHRLFVANAGQRLFESVFILYRGGAYPWNIREGTRCFDPADDRRPPSTPCPVTAADGRPLIGPVIETGHDLGNTVVGGVLYRGSALPDLAGSYVFGTWTSGSPAEGNGSLLAAAPPAGIFPALLPRNATDLDPATNRMWQTQLITILDSGNGRIDAYVRALAENRDHEILVLTNHAAGPGPSAQGTGEVWLVVPAEVPEAAATLTVTTMPDPASPAPAGNTISLTLTVRDNGYDRTSHSAPAGSDIVLTFVNEDEVVHGFSLYTDRTAETRIFRGTPLQGPGTTVYRFTAPSRPGTLYFRCDLNPVTMNGDFIVT